MRIYFSAALLLLSAFSFSQDAKFSRIGAEKGLSQASVKCILQDSKGYMWFGTGDGLNRYDGYEMKIFRNNPSDTNSLSDNNIECLVEDSKGILWIGTHGGLNAYNAALNRFHRFQNERTNPNSINGNVIKSIYEDKKGTYWVGTPYGLNSFDGIKNFFTKYQHAADDTLSLNGFRVDVIHEDKKNRLWVCTYDGGINLFDRNKKTFTCYQDVRNIAGVQPEFFNRITSLAEDESGNFWLATDNGGVAEFNPETKKFLKRYLHDGKTESLSDNRVFSLCFDEKNILWFGTKTGGITCFDKRTGKFFYYMNNDYDVQSLASDDINYVYKDREGNLWIGTGDGGVCVYFPNSAKFRHYHRDVTNEHAFLSNTIMAILQAKNGDVWLGTKNGGITIIDRATNSYINYGDGSQYSALTSKDNSAISLYEDEEGLIWIGTWGAGLNSFDRKTNKIENVINTGAITCLAPGHKNILWVGFYGGGHGLYAFNRDTKNFTQYTRQEGLSSDDIYCVYEDKNEKVYIGTIEGGLNVLDFKTGKIKIYQHVNTKNSISDNQVNCIYDDGKGNLWLGTSNGLNKFNGKTEQFSAYYEADGLPGNYINGILCDKRGNLWLSTNNGISRFNPNIENTEGAAFKNFSEHDGLQGKEFNVGSFFQNKKTGEMFFGGINGFNSFYPDNISDNKHIPPVYITSFKKFGKEVALDTTVSDKKYIELSYRENFISFEFVALDYIFPEKNKYSFTMDGLDNDWSPPTARRYVSYTNLPGGDYVFRVKASNSDGVWNEKGISLYIKVIPPWWKTTAFYVVCVLFAIAFVFGFIRFRTAAIQKENKILEQKVAERTAELAQKNKDITSSIQYAKRIQDAILPTREQIQKHFPESFVLFKPKDIVSGDFYWFGEKNGKKIAACVDCTGHGVPGAFMSMIGTNLLNQIILEDGVTEPSAILSALNHGVRSALKQGANAEIETTDGMDIAFCSFDVNKREMQFSSAQRNLIIVRENNLEKIDGNKFPIGGAQLDAERIFTNHFRPLKKGEMFYMFSDGYADQFGGERGKKFMVKKLHETLLSLHTLPLTEQKILLEKTLEDWRGSYNQVDDVLVIGIRM
ncbi:MAG: SpoIIE family protein phosphatase [Bacteroidetes bacterium]|nr:SpoIIE family protein phosphatase [Bacteroidota bacterium]